MSHIKNLRLCSTNDNFSNSSQEKFVSEIKQKITLISGDILDNSNDFAHLTLKQISMMESYVNFSNLLKETAELNEIHGNTYVH